MKNSKPSVLVTGANGQLGNELRVVAADYPTHHFIFTSRKELAVDDADAVKRFFAEQQIDYCINCAAYTAVDKAESDPEAAYRINETAAACLATLCNEHHTRLIHISTDYVFNGQATEPYKEDDPTNPLGVYGVSKRKGEEAVLKNDPSAVIIRTSWLYSSFGHNFVKTMLRLMKERESINVVNDQSGCPTYAADLAAAIMQIITSGINKPGIYHYSNAGASTWYELAAAIKELTGSKCIINPVTTAEYPTPAKRPAYSVFDTAKIRSVFGLVIPQWKDSLAACLNRLK